VIVYYYFFGTLYKGTFKSPSMFCLILMWNSVLVRPEFDCGIAHSDFWLPIPIMRSFSYQFLVERSIHI
jgi:hypothetical protein